MPSNYYLDIIQKRNKKRKESKAPKTHKKVAILFSGGLDSTGLLKYALERGYEVDLIYCKILNNPNKTEREIKSIELIIDYFNKKYDKSINLRINEVMYYGKPLTTLLQVPSHIISSISVSDNTDEIWIGYVMGDDAISQLSDIKNIYKSYKHLYAYENSQPKLKFPFKCMQKPLIYGYICDGDIDVLKYATFCESEHLDNDQRCGECHSCRRYDYEFNEGVAPEFKHFNSKIKK